MLSSAPSIEAYNQALQLPQISLQIPQFKKCQVRSSALTGQPIAMCGGFALTYTLTDPQGQKWALRCFHKYSPGLTERYKEISNALKRANSPYFVPFEFYSQGIKVGNGFYPMVVMKWASGETLGQFFENYHQNAQALSNFLQALRTMSVQLKNLHIAHGDLQPGNIMVADNGHKIQLIDYDGMYVPTLVTAGSRECGHINFQHPQRGDHWTEKLDNFSLILLDLMTQALIKRPKFWEDSSSDFDRFILSANDFKAPSQSKGFSLLQQLAELRGFIDKFQRVCEGSFDDIPDYMEFIKGFTRFSEVIYEEYEEEQAYCGPYRVLSALDFSSAVEAVGDVVELIGKIYDFKPGLTKNNKPYLFINFKPFHFDDRITLVIWSNSGLSTSVEQWLPIMRKWISVSGLLQPVYTSTSFKGQQYSSVSIFPDDTTNFKVINEDEAMFRLGRTKRKVKLRRAIENKASQSHSALTLKQDLKSYTNAHENLVANTGKTYSNTNEYQNLHEKLSKVFLQNKANFSEQPSSSVSYRTLQQHTVSFKPSTNKDRSSTSSNGYAQRQPSNLGSKPGSAGLNDHLKDKFLSSSSTVASSSAKTTTTASSNFASAQNTSASNSNNVAHSSNNNNRQASLNFREQPKSGTSSGKDSNSFENALIIIVIIVFLILLFG